MNERGKLVTAALWSVFVYGVNTFHYIQCSVQYGREHALDVAHDSTHQFISNIKHISAYYYWVNVAKIKFSWKTEQNKNQGLL